jgi:hypothetical protein
MRTTCTTTSNTAHSNAHLTGTDGTKVGVHDNAQAASNANGVITVSFDHMFVVCGG